MTRMIDADALLKELRKSCEYHAENSREFSLLQRDIIIVQEQPTIDAEPHWIPCSKRLPENMELVNVTWVNRDPEPYYMNIKDKPFTATGIYFKGKWYWYSVTCEDMLGEYGENEIDEVADGVEIVAWMPLPKPYEVEDEKTD